ncbi:MAG: hypothetical protein QGH51_08845 [Planctomycetota bacterium]|jgi:hypothetical protein|nr:hypothetical protein [Planctomycetota bacterium]MDP6942116.1 hypothetical protein [Planctomycetota bacterium]
MIPNSFEIHDSVYFPVLCGHKKKIKCYPLGASWGVLLSFPLPQEGPSPPEFIPIPTSEMESESPPVERTDLLLWLAIALLLPTIYVLASTVWDSNADQIKAAEAQNELEQLVSE